MDKEKILDEIKAIIIETLTEAGNKGVTLAQLPLLLFEKNGKFLDL